MLKPSDLVLIKFHLSNRRATKRRPALVVREPSQYGDIVAVAITSKPQSVDGIAMTQSDLALGKLVKPSWVRCDQLHAFALRWVPTQLSVDIVGWANHFRFAHRFSVGR